MESTLTIVLGGAALGVVLVAAGICIGRSVRFGRGGSAHPHVSRAVDLRKLTGRLHRLVASVADDVGEHQTRIEQVSRELASMPAAEGSSLTGVFLDTVSRAMQINERLQDRLSAAEEKLQEQARQIEIHLNEARTDALTALPNRRAFDDELARRIAEWQRKQTTFCLVMVDLDHFKPLNDRHGHPAGDHVLRAVADVLRSTLREMDIVARVGGEEFAIILPTTSAHDGTRAAERVRTTIAAHEFQLERSALQVTVSLGLAGVQAGDDPGAILRRADEALYASKRAGRNCGHLHTGQTCHRILSSPPFNPGGSGDGDPSDSLQPEFATVCDDLRRRLGELTGEP